MQTIEHLRRQIKSAQDLLSVVKTMKALAAVNIRHYERAVESLAEYNRSVEMGLHILLRSQQQPTITGGEVDATRLGAVVFGSDQGLCGQFNERIVSFAVDQMAQLTPRPDGRQVLAVGIRSAALLDEYGCVAEECLEVPGGLAGITLLVQELLLRLESWRLRDHREQIVLFHHRLVTGVIYQPQMVRLLPVDLNWLRQLQTRAWPSRVLPTFSMEPERLLSALIRQHMFVNLYRACAESLASEDASRLASMQNAERNIEDRLGELHQRYHSQRQNLITAELLDIIGGFEAVTTANP